MKPAYVAFAIGAVGLSLGIMSCCGNKKDDDAVIDAAAAQSVVLSAEPPSSSASAVPTVSAEPPKNVVKPVTNDASSVRACCSAIHADASKASGKDKEPYQAAEGVCNSLVKTVEKGTVTPSAAKLTIRAQLQRARSIPGACK